MVTPSEEDRKEVLNEVTEYANQLGTAADMNTFIRSTGSVVPFSEIAINKTVYPNDVVARLDSVTINEVYGPYYNQADDSYNAFISAVTGTGSLVKQTSPTLITPVLGTASATGITITKVNGQQTTSLTTAIVANGYAGVLQTIAPSVASGTSVLIPVTNNKVLTSSVIDLQLEYPDSGTGIPHVVISSVANGSFVIKVTNLHATNAINTVMKFHYSIV